MHRGTLIGFCIFLTFSGMAAAKEGRVEVTPQGKAVDHVLHLTPTDLIVASALMLPSSSIHQCLDQDVHDLQACLASWSIQGDLQEEAGTRGARGGP